MTITPALSAQATEAIWQALAQLSDPEIPVVSLHEMGILRDVRVLDEGHAEVTITPTYSGCPAMEQIHDDIIKVVNTLGYETRVITQLAPAWTTDWMSDVAKEKLRAYGIAPPHACHTHTPAQGQVVSFMAARQTNSVACPQCGSHNTTETSHFGSTACKALYKCLDCMEPFDYFKPY